MGVGHTIAEGTVLGWYGVSLHSTDLLIFAISYVLTGAAFGLALNFVARLARRKPGPASTRFFLWAVATAYCVSMLLQVFQSAIGIAAVALGVVAALAMLVITLAGVRRADSPLSAFLVPLGVAFSALGATLLSGQWFEVAEMGKRTVLGLTLLTPPAIVAAWLYLLRSGAQSFPAPRSVVVAAVALAIHGGLTVTVWPSQFGWHVDHPAEREGSPDPSRPNILLLVLDTVRAQSLELYGHDRETMPFLTRFATEECDYYAPMLANAAETLPSHASMFTGHFVYSHGAHKPYLSERDSEQGYMHHLDDRHPTLAGWLGSEGYRTAAISANSGVISGYGLKRGFQHFDVVSSDASLGIRSSWLFGIRVGDRSIGTALKYRLPLRVSEATLFFSRMSPGFRRADKVRELATSWLERNGSDPYFLFLNFLDPHNPYYPLQPYRDRFVPEDSSATWEWEGFPTAAWRAAIFSGQPMPPQDVEHAEALYEAELAYLDAELEKFLGPLVKSGSLDHTLLIVVGDHGEEFWEHGAMLHGGNVYAPQVRVPFMVRFPKNMRPDSFPPSTHMQHVDFIASIADMLGMEPPAPNQGAPWGHGRRFAMAENYVHWGRGPYYEREQVAIQIGDLKYIHSSDGTEELYHLASDPAERNNVMSSYPNVVTDARLIAELREETIEAMKSMQEGEGPAVDSEELRERLRALGYID